MDRNVSMYQGTRVESPAAEERAEFERRELAREIVEAWRPDGTDLTAAASLISAIKQTLDEARARHNEHYMFALITEFNLQTTNIKLDTSARTELDTLIQEQLDNYRIES